MISLVWPLELKYQSSHQSETIDDGKNGILKLTICGDKNMTQFTNLDTSCKYFYAGVSKKLLSLISFTIKVFLCINIIVWQINKEFIYLEHFLGHLSTHF